MGRTKRRRDQQPRLSGPWIAERDAVGNHLIIQHGACAGHGATVLLFHVSTLMHLEGTVGCVLPGTSRATLDSGRVCVDTSCVQWRGVPFRDERKEIRVHIPPNFLYVLTNDVCTRLNLPRDLRGAKLSGAQMRRIGLPTGAPVPTCSEPDRPVVLLEPKHRLVFATHAQRLSDTSNEVQVSAVALPSNL